MIAEDATPEEALAEFTRLTSGDLGDARDFLSMTPEQQAQTLDNYRHAGWRNSSNTIGEIIAVLGVIGTVAGDLTGVGGAVSLFKSLA